MPYIENEGVKLYYEIEGEGPPVMMVHGFSSNLEWNWINTGWVDYLKDSYKLILMDCRGHGKSEKPYDDTNYMSLMVSDVYSLLKELSIEKANFFGYSMGSHLVFQLLLDEPHLFTSTILGGFAGFSVITMNDAERIRYRERSLNIIEALKVDDISQITDPAMVTWRQNAEERGNDLESLTALIKSDIEQPLGWKQLRWSDLQEGYLNKIKVPVLTVAGSDDHRPWTWDKTLIAQLVPGACHFQIQGKGHIDVVRDAKFKWVVKAFLDHVNY